MFLSDINVSKSTDLVSISHNILKLSANSIAPCRVYIINNHILNRLFSSMQLEAKVMKATILMTYIENTR